MATPTRRRNGPAKAPSNVVGLPTFRHPAQEPPPDLPGPDATQDMPLIEERTTGPTLPNHGGSWVPYGGVGSADTIPGRTADSSDQLTTGASKAEIGRNAGIFLGALISVGFGIAALGLSRVGRRLRRPDRDETKDMARPLARVLMRHLPADMITADLADLGEAGAAVERYMSAGPIAPRVVPVQHIGMPDHEDNPAPTTPAAPTPGQVWHDATTTVEHPSALYTDQGEKPEVRYHS